MKENFNIVFIVHKSRRIFQICSILVLITSIKESGADWNFWWTFDGISGPEFWGILNPDWHLCSKGHRQSPVDIKPSLLLYDPNLRPIQMAKHRVNGVLENNGHSVVFHLNSNQEESDSFNSITSSSSHSPNNINISGGPLSYTYNFHSLHFHFGRTDAYGSEHTIAGLTFPGEVGETSSVELRLLTSQLQHIRYRGQNVTLKSLSLRDLVPDDQFYMTYEGSLTMPACSEVVTWIIINKPLFITRQQLYALRKLMQGEVEVPKAPLGNNYRPIQPMNERVVRTNIDFKRNQGTACPTMRKNLHYEEDGVQEVVHWNDLTREWSDSDSA